jgi:hypothetical protein
MFSKGYSSITKEDILKRISESSLLSYYFGVSEIPSIINSPLREDLNPSLSLFSNDGIKIKFHDFGSMENGSIFDLLGKYWNLSFKDVLIRIDKDLNNKSLSSKLPQIPICSTKEKNSKTCSKNTILQCKIRKWKSFDLEYWNSYGVSKEWLIFGDIYPISHVILHKNGKDLLIPADKYAYVYVEIKEEVTLKIYQPFSSKYKWINKNDYSVWNLWNKLPKVGEYLIITSSRKDSLCLWENTGIPSTAMQAESVFPKPQIIQELKNRFKYIFILYDNDFKGRVNWGRSYGKSLADKFNLLQIEIPTEFQSKDPSDLVHNHGRECLKSLISKLIKEKL